MQMNSGIILSGQQPNLLAAMMEGQQAAQQQNALATDRQTRELYAKHGAGMVAGDPAAINALAGMNPEAALGIQGARLGMDQTRLGMDATRLGMDQTRQEMHFSKERLQMAYASAAQEAQQAAINLSKEQREAEAAKLDGLLSGAAFFYSKGDRAGYEAYVAQNGLDAAQYPFEQFPAIAARGKGTLDALKTFQDMAAPTDPTEGAPSGYMWNDPANRAGGVAPLPGFASKATGDRFKVVGSQLVDTMAEGGPKAVMASPGQEEVIFGPDGKPMLVRGPAGSAAKFTEGQSKDNIYATRAVGALETLDPVADALTGVGNRALDMDPTGVLRGNMQDEQYQVAKQAGDEFLQAILRKDTGAAITAEEAALYGKTYLPMPGDNAAVLAQKKVSRARAVEAIKSGMNQDQIAAMARADAAVIAKFGGSSGGSPAQSDVSDDDLLRMYGGE